MKRTFKVAVVGCGTISYNHIVSLKLLKNCKITALCDKDAEKAQQRKAEFQLDCSLYTDFHKMLDFEELDAIHVCTPHYLHAEMTIEALKRGIYVFLEKPMCISRNEVDAMLEAEKSSSAKTCVCFQNRLNDAFVYAKKLVQDSNEKFSGYFSVFWYRGENYYTDSDWRGRLAKEGGGVMINQAIHSLDMMISLLGKPKSVTATTANHHLKNIIEVEDSCEGVINFESGAQASFYATTASYAGDRITLVLRSPSYHIEMRGFDLTVNGEKISFPERISYLGKEYYGSAHPRLIEDFYTAIETGKDMPVPLDSAQYAVRTLLAAYESQDKEIYI